MQNKIEKEHVKFTDEVTIDIILVFVHQVVAEQAEVQNKSVA
jgi:hypothetical protein